MRIDMHTHAYPTDALAAKNVVLGEESTGFKPVTGGTVGHLINFMDSVGIDKAVVQCVSPDGLRVTKVNDWAMSVQSDRVVMFGAMHPDCQDPASEIRRLKQGGIKGIKLHPEANAYYPDDKRLFPIYEEIGEDMVIFCHSGAEFLDGRENYAFPARIAKVLDNFPRLKMVAAHFGGYAMLNESREHLVGRNIYLDTQWQPSMRLIGDPAVITDIIRKHGADRIVFGTDFPFMRVVKGEMDYICSLPLSAAEKEGILGENARRLLNL